MTTFRLEIVTADKVGFSEDVTMLTAWGFDGQFTILPHHAPFMTVLQPGELVIKKDLDSMDYDYSGYSEEDQAQIQEWLDSGDGDVPDVWRNPADVKNMAENLESEMVDWIMTGEKVSRKQAQKIFDNFLKELDKEIEDYKKEYKEIYKDGKSAFSDLDAKGKSIKVFDNGNDFTVVIGKNVYEMNDEAMMPNGVNIFLGEISEFPDKNFGKKVKTIPDQVKRAIKEREPETELLAKGIRTPKSSFLTAIDFFISEQKSNKMFKGNELIDLYKGFSVKKDGKWYAMDRTMDAKGLQKGFVNTKIYDARTVGNTSFKIQETGDRWTLYVTVPAKTKGKKKWEKIQTSYDAKFLQQVMLNQSEFKKVKNR